jgi:hypothetical protein
MLRLRKRIGRTNETPFVLISILCDGSVMDDYDVVKEVCVEGKRMKSRMTDSIFCELLYPSGIITEESLEKMI